MKELANNFAMNTDIKTIRKEFRRSKEARFIHRLHGVLLVLQGLSTTKAGQLLGDPQRSISHWVIQFREGGIDALQDAEKSGRPATLDPHQKKALLAALKKSPSAFGFEGDTWTGLLVSRFLKERCGADLTMRHSRRLLREFENSNGE